MLQAIVGMPETLTLYGANGAQPARFLERARSTAHTAGCDISASLDRDRLVLTIAGDPALTQEVGAWIVESWREWRRDRTLRMAS